MRVVVVGAGIIGCAIARELAVRGVSCIVLDPRPIGGGATQASAGMLAPYVEAHEQGPLLDLAVRSLSLYDEWIAAVRAEARVDVEYRRIGTLEVALDADRAGVMRRAAGAHASWLDGPAAMTNHPALGRVAGALFTREHGYVAPPQLTPALARAAERAGASFRTTSVARISSSRESIRVFTAEGDEQADRVIFAAGAWTNAIEGVTSPPLRPVRGQLLRLGWNGPNLPATIVWGPDCYVVPRLDRSVLVGATVEEAGFDERATAAGVRDLLEAGIRILPDLSSATFLEVRVGLRPATPDGLPVLGTDPRVPGLIHASGHYRNGVLLAPITAKAIADLVVAGATDVDLKSFRADRFHLT
jgi:glycine oxidase